MRRLFQGPLLTLVAVGFLLLSAGCASTASRLPAAFKPKYDSQVVRSLTTAALNRVLFQVDELTFRDVPSRQIDQCRSLETSTWSQEFLDFLRVMDRNPGLYEKFNIVEFKRGDHAAVEITHDIDGASSLIVSYGKREQFEKITAATRMPCSESPSEYIGKDLVTTSIDWPNAAQVIDVLQNAPLRNNVERFQFNTDFLVYLAERQGILKIKPEVAFERNFKGDYFLVSWLDSMAKQIKTQKPDQDYVTYWMREISIRSAQAKTIQFFGLFPEGSANIGVQVDKAEKLALKLNNLQVPTYLFMSYREHNGEYIYGNMQDLNNCLQNLTGTYRNSLSGGSVGDAATFLAPGYSCAVSEIP